MTRPPQAQAHLRELLTRVSKTDREKNKNEDVNGSAGKVRQSRQESGATFPDLEALRNRQTERLDKGTRDAGALVASSHGQDSLANA